MPAMSDTQFKLFLNSVRMGNGTSMFPDQPRAPKFDGRNITLFCKTWEERCDDWGWDEKKQVKRFPQYTSSSALRDDCEALDGYLEKNWDDYKQSLLNRFEARDKRVYTVTRLRSLVEQYVTNPDPDDLEGYLREFRKISAVLVQNEVMTKFAQMRYLFQGLPSGLFEQPAKNSQAW